MFILKILYRCGSNAIFGSGATCEREVCVHKYFIQNLFGRNISGLATSLFLATAMAVLAGCGSGQAIPSIPLPAISSTAGPVPATIQLLTSATQMPSAGTVTIDLTVIVLDASKQTIKGKTVTISPGSDPTAFVNGYSEAPASGGGGVTDKNGVVTAKLNLGGNKTNRTITLTASSDSASVTNTIDVTGTTIAISGNSSLASGATTTLTFSVKDSAGTAIQGAAVTVASTNGNTVALSSATGTTNSSGQMSADITATKAGNDTITVSAAGATATQALTISSASFSFATPAAKTEIPLTGTQTVTVNWSDVPAPTGPVNFAISRGTAAPTTAALVAGSASTTISSTDAGPAIITASGTGGTPAATLEVVFVATSATKAALQAVPGTVEVSSGLASQTNNSSTITVQVRDASNNLVKNAGVSFSLTDVSGGRLTSATGVTDISGSASVTYIAGGTSSAQNGVTVTATVTDIKGATGAATFPSGAVTASTTLTASGQSLQVRLGTDNLVGADVVSNAYIKTYLAVVTDSAGNPKVGTKVNFVLRPGTYRKGVFLFGTTVWTPNPSTVPSCANEDLNFNGSLDPGEGLVVWPAGTAVPNPLLPGTVATVNATATTDAFGIAIATIAYPKNHAYWNDVTLEARTSVTSNDPPTTTTFSLPYAATDYNDASKLPPGQTSPYGTGGSCGNTL